MIPASSFYRAVDSMFSSRGGCLAAGDRQSRVAQVAGTEPWSSKNCQEDHDTLEEWQVTQSCITRASIVAGVIHLKSRMSHLFFAQGMCPAEVLLPADG